MSSLRRSSIRSPKGSRSILFIGVVVVAVVLLGVQIVRPSDSYDLRSIQEFANAVSLLTTTNPNTGGTSRETSSLRNLPKLTPPASSTAPSSETSPYSDVEITCDAVQEKLDNKTWYDPNDGTYLIRKTRFVSVNEPIFFVSVHKKEYDPLRHETIYEGYVEPRTSE